jgi:hypothetical protein
MVPAATPTVPLTVPPADPRALRTIWRKWEPERPELLIRLRPRPVRPGVDR